MFSKKTLKLDIHVRNFCWSVSWDSTRAPRKKNHVATGVLINEEALKKNGFLLRIYLSIPCWFGVADYCCLAKASRRAFWEVIKRAERRFCFWPRRLLKSRKRKKNEGPHLKCRLDTKVLKTQKDFWSFYFDLIQTLTLFIYAALGLTGSIRSKNEKLWLKHAYGFQTNEEVDSPTNGQSWINLTAGSTLSMARPISLEFSSAHNR